MSITEINAIDENFPVAGIDQPSDTFRDNFGNIKTALLDLDGQVVTIINDLDDVDTTTSSPVVNDLLIFDGADWVPGVPATNIVLDTTPQLGGNLEVGAFDLTSEGNVILSFSTGGETSVNWLDIKNSITTIAPIIKAVGTDANIDMILSTKGTSAVVIASGTTTSRIKAEVGSSLEISTQDDAVGRNITMVAGSATGESGGNGGSIQITPGAKDGLGTAGSIFLRDQDDNVVVNFAGPITGIGVNNMLFRSSATGNAPALRIFGADTNIDFVIATKGAGQVVLAGLSYPSTDGTVGQALTTDGSGNIGFSTVSGGLANVVDDTTPQLGGNLDVNGKHITSVSNGNVVIKPDGTGEFEMGFVFYSKRISQPIVDNTTAVFLTYLASPQSAMFVDYLIIRTASNVRTGTLTITNTLGTVSVLDTGTSVGDVQVTFSGAINTGNVEISYIAAATASAGVMQYQTRRFEDT